VRDQRWWGGDVGEHIGIDCDAVSSLVALDVREVARGRGLSADEHKMRTRQAGSGVAVRRMGCTHDSSPPGAGLDGPDHERWEER